MRHGTGRPSAERRVSARLASGAVFVVVLSVLLGLGAQRWTQSRNDDTVSEYFDATVSRTMSRLEQRMATYEYGLRGARGAVIAAGPDRISRDDFHRYSLSRDIDREFPGARGFGFVRRVRPADEAAFLAQARRDGAPDFKIREFKANQAERYVVQYIEPVERNRVAIGLDLASEDYRRAAALRAMQTGRATMTAPIILVQASGIKQHGFLLLLPVMQKTPSPVGQTEEMETTVGWSMAPLLIDEVLAGLNFDAEAIGISIADRTAFSSTPFFATANADADAQTTISRMRTATVFNRTWDVTVSARPQFIAQLHLFSPLATGILTSTAAMLVALLANLALSSRQRAKRAGVDRSRLAAIVENAEDAIVGMTIDGVITDWNPGAQRLFGFTPLDAIGRPQRDLIVPSHLGDEEQEMLSNIRRGTPIRSLATTRLRKDGGTFPVEVSWSAILTPSGETVGIAAVIRDITERVEAAEVLRSLNASLEEVVTERTAELRAASALQQSILTNAGYAIIATDRNGTVTLFNPSAERLLGYPAADIIGKTSPSIFHDPAEVAIRAQQLSREVGRLVEPGFDVFVERARGGFVDVREWTYLTKAGGRVPVLLNVSALRAEDGQDLGFLGIAVDQTERYQHEAEMKAASAGTWSYEVATGRLHLSAECARQHGLAEAAVEIDVDRDWRALAHADDVPRVLADVKAAMTNGGGYMTEFRVPLPDGSFRWITAMGRVKTDPSGRTVRVLGLTLDTTLRKEAEIALAAAKITAETARAQAERATSAKTDFLAAMSHEIRTPLNAIIGFTNLMLGSGRLDPDLKRQAELVQSSGVLLLTIVNDILDFSKVEAGAIELVLRPFAVAALVDNCVSIVRSLADAKGLEVRAHLDPTLPGWLLGDDARLRQILINLLNNAVKFTETGSVTIDVRHEGSSAEGEFLRFQVLDTGIGIPEDKHHRLFQRFSQVDNSIERDYGGTGLGLAICKRLVELMEGEIGVSSPEGSGSTFWFTVRLRRTIAAGPLPAISNGSVRSRAGRLLLVEDSMINQELARAVLEAAGHTVETVADGATAVQAVEEGRFDLVLMDVQMPGMDGMTATRMIRLLADPVRTIPVIAMTANVLPEQVQAFREAGMDDHVGKPFDQMHLYKTIERWLPA